MTEIAAKTSPETQRLLRELADLPSSTEVASRLAGLSDAVVGDLLQALDAEQNELAGRADEPSASAAYDKLDALRSQVQAHRGYQSIDEAV